MRVDLIKWRIHPDPESNEDVPMWYRPSSIQESKPQDLCYDLWAWPRLCDALPSRNNNHRSTKFNMDMCENITIGWPDRELLIVSLRCDGAPIPNPDFEPHIMQHENWRVKKAWANIYPDLVESVNVAEESEK